MTKRDTKPLNANTTSQTRIQSTAEILELLDINKNTLNNWRKRGCPHDKRVGAKGARYDEAEVAAWLKSEGLGPKSVRESGVIAPAFGESPKLKAEIRKHVAMAEKYEMDVAERRGKLVSRDLVETRFANVGVAIRSSLQGMGAQLSPSIVGKSAAQIQRAIDKEVERRLSELCKLKLPEFAGQKAGGTR